MLILAFKSTTKIQYTCRMEFIGIKLAPPRVLYKRAYIIHEDINHEILIFYISYLYYYLATLTYFRHIEQVK